MVLVTDGQRANGKYPKEYEFDETMEVKYADGTVKTGGYKLKKYKEQTYQIVKCNNCKFQETLPIDVTIEKCPICGNTIESTLLNEGFNLADKTQYKRFTLAKLSSECRYLGEETCSIYKVEKNKYFQEEDDPITGKKSVVIDDYSGYDPRKNGVFSFMKDNINNTTNNTNNNNTSDVNGGGAAGSESTEESSTNDNIQQPVTPNDPDDVDDINP